MEKIIAYTDGSCQSHEDGSQFGAWGYVFGSPDSHILVSQVNGRKNTTSMAMELAAIINCLEMLIYMRFNFLSVTLYADTKFAVDAINDGHLANWSKNDWRGSRGKIKNKALWQEIYLLLSRFPKLKINWVRGHSGDEGNEFIDKRIRKYIEENDK